MQSVHYSFGMTALRKRRKHNMNYVTLMVVSLLAVAFSRLTLVTVFERSMLTASISGIAGNLMIYIIIMMLHLNNNTLHGVFIIAIGLTNSAFSALASGAIMSNARDDDSKIIGSTLFMIAMVLGLLTLHLTGVNRV